ncbi:hypothetical protein A2U01_0093050, partial [Trifolium medium]|nr:hypothetical protein [Trifolium medium]
MKLRNAPQILTDGATRRPLLRDTQMPEAPSYPFICWRDAQMTEESPDLHSITAQRA